MNKITNNFNAVNYLGKDDLPELSEALNTVCCSLIGNAVKHFRHRSKMELNDHLASGMPILAIRRNGEISGTAMLCLPDKYKTQKMKQRALAGYPFEPFNESKVTVMQGVAVLPFMRGKGIMRDIFHEVATFAIKNNRNDLIAKVHADNVKSLSLFRGYGFEIYATRKDAHTGRPVYYMNADAGRVWFKYEDRKLGLSDTPPRHTINT